MNLSRKQSVVVTELPAMSESHHTAVIPAEAGIHVALKQEAKMDSSLLKAEHVHVLSPRARLRRNDGNEEYLALQVIGRLLLIAKPIWS